jgi:hypothetical protein
MNSSAEDTRKNESTAVTAKLLQAVVGDATAFGEKPDLTIVFPNVIGRPENGDGP